jgi:hypothetical protein
MDSKSDNLSLDHVLASQQRNTESDDENRTFVLQWTSTDETDTTLTAEKEEEEDNDDNDGTDTDGQTTTQHPSIHPIMDTMRAYLSAATSRFFKSKDVTPEDTLLRCTEEGSTTTPTSRASSPPINSSLQSSPAIQQPALRHRGRSLRRMPQSKYNELTSRSSSLPPDAVRTHSSLGSIAILPRRGSGQRSPLASRFGVFDDSQPMTRAQSTQSSSITAISPDTSYSTLINSNTRNNRRHTTMLTEQLWGLQRPPMLDLMPTFAPPVPAEDLDRVWATVTDSITADNSIIIDGPNEIKVFNHSNNNNDNTTSSITTESNLSSVNEGTVTNTNTNGTTVRPSAMVTYGPAAGFLPYDLISTAVYSTAYPELYPRVYPPARSSAPTPPPPPASSLLMLPTTQTANTNDHGHSLLADKSGCSSTGSSATASVCSGSHTPQSVNQHGLDENLFQHGLSDKRNLLRQNRLLRTQLETMRALLEQAKSDLRQEREARRIVENCHQEARLKWETEIKSCMHEVITVRDDNRRLRDLVESLGGDPDSGSLLEADSILTADTRRDLSRNGIDINEDEDEKQVNYASHWYDNEIHGDNLTTKGGTGKTGALRRRGTMVHLRPSIILTKEQPNSTEPAYRVGADLDRFSLNQFGMNSWMDEIDDNDTNELSNTRSGKSAITTPAGSSRASFYSSSDEDDEDDDENDNETSSTSDSDDDSGDDDDDEISDQEQDEEEEEKEDDNVMNYKSSSSSSFTYYHNNSLSNEILSQISVDDIEPDISHICPSVPVSETELDDDDDDDEDEKEEENDDNDKVDTNEHENQETTFVDSSTTTASTEFTSTTQPSPNLSKTLSSSALNTLPLLASSKLDAHSATSTTTRNTYRRQAFSDIVEQYLHQAHTSHLGVAAILLAIDDLATKHAAHNENMLSIIIGAYLNAMDDIYACEADKQVRYLYMRHK